MAKKHYVDEEELHEKKLNYMQIGCNLAGFALETKHHDLLVSMYDLVTEKGGNAALDDIVRVSIGVEERDVKRQIDTEIRKQEYEKKYGKDRKV